MKRIYLVIVVVLLSFSICLKAELSELITQFSSSKYSEWSYNNPNVLLNAQSISGNKILIYNINSQEYSLTSNSFDLSKWETVTIIFNWRAISYDQKEYDKIKNSPLITIINSDNNEIIDSHQYKISESQLITAVSVDLQVKGLNNCIFKINAPLSDSNNTGSINKITVYGNKLTGVEDVICDNNIFKVEKNRIHFYNLNNATIKIINLRTGVADVEYYNIYGNHTTRELSDGFYGIHVNGKVSKIMIYD